MSTQHITMTDNGEMTIIGHLIELRSRLIKALIALTCGIAVSYYFIDPIILFLTAPAGKLYFMRPAEAFFIYFKVAVMAGAIFSSPILFYQFWAFLVPAFTRQEKRALSMLVPASLGLFVMGIAFSYFLCVASGTQIFYEFYQ